MLTRTQRLSTLLMALMFLQVLAPIALASAGSTSSFNTATDAEVESLQQLGISPAADAEHGWLASQNGVSSTHLLHRDVTMIAPDDWTDATGGQTLNGFHILSHSYPVPSSWFGALDAAGISCHSFLPPAAFHCDVNGKTPQQLGALDVQGIAVMDATDKVQTNLVLGLLGLETTYENPFINQAGGIVNVVLSGTSLPENIGQQDGISVDTHNGRFSTMAIDTTGLAWLAQHHEIEWIEAKPVFEILNTEGIEVMHVDDLWDGTTMSNIDSSWSGLDGSGIIVTVADTGLDNGINNSAMHPDFKDHIKGILSFPPPPSTCTYYGLSPCGDSAEDFHGHGTHVAGSVLGDGTHSNGGIVGAASESQLLFHAIATTQGGEEKLLGIPNDLDDLFSLAWDNGSRIHTNSWGSAENGAYTTSSMQADSSARTYDELVILFAASNEGVDVNSDGEIDLDSLGSPASAKNVITVGASENNRGNLNYLWGSTDYGSPISTDKLADNPDGMAAFSSRGPTDDNRLKPDISAPGTFILSTKSRSTSDTGWLAHNASYTYMGGTSMATPLTAGATALLLEHLIENVGESNPTSALVKAIYTASAHDMTGQYSSSTNGAGEAAPNNHEGWGRVNMSAALNTSWIQEESVTTNADSGWSFIVPSSADDFTISLSWTDPASTPTASTNLVNNLDLAVKDPSGTWTNVSNNVDNLLAESFSSPAQGTWEVHILGTSVPTGPQFFAVAMTGNYSLTNLTQDADFDGTIDADDDCENVAGTSTEDRIGCPDTDGDGYSNPDSGWTVNNGADAFSSDSTQWADADYDGYGDNSAGTEADGCPSLAGNSTADRYGCTDADGDGYSNPDSGWTTSNGADSCASVSGASSQDRNGCADTDSDGYSDPDSGWTVGNGADAFSSDATQWADGDGDGYGDNPPPATDGDRCPSVSGTSTNDRFGCTDSDGDGYSDPDSGWTTGNGADVFPSDASQWADGDGDGYGDNSTGTNPDACPVQAGTSTEAGRLGCTDTDGDGYADLDDAFPTEVTQWNDSDADGYGDEASGFEGDDCPSSAGASSRDRFGCLDTDGDGSSDADSGWTMMNGADLDPNDSTQWADADGDTFGDNPSGTNGDSCPSVAGTSNQDRFGCPDTDGDGYSNPDSGWTENEGADAYPSDATRWADSDGDGYDDGIDDDCPSFPGTSLHDRKGCPDQDGDGYSDPDSAWTVSSGADAFMSDSTQWNDTDADGFGDEALGNLPDACPSLYGTSWQNSTYGCLDGDEDGWADSQDSHPDEISQWSDVDGDGYGDNPGGVFADACVNSAGNSTLGNRYGCIDNDGDGWDNTLDALPDLATQWLDQDGDGYGDNASGIQPDACPGESGTSTVDRFGCDDDDGDGVSNLTDAFPNEASQWSDIDGDGFGDNSTGVQADVCPNVSGTSTIDRIGCLDSDTDGVSDPTEAIGNTSAWNVSDGADALPFEVTQSVDTDGDGYGENASGLNPDACPTTAGTSTIDRYGCVDGDGDGASDENDLFLADATQWYDADGDGFGDNEMGTTADNCTGTAGTSTLDRYGCPDTDSDGVSDENDVWPADPTQWFDTDGDGYGNQPDGTNGDTCPMENGTSTEGGKRGCLDTDGDGWADADDWYPLQSSQHFDSDGDGWGDNASLGAYKPDHWPNDAQRNSAEGTMTCTPTSISIDLAESSRFTFSCTASTTMTTSFAARVEWQGTNDVIGDSTTQYLTFTPSSGNTQTVMFSGDVQSTGIHQIVLMLREPGVENPMETVTVTLKTTDSNAPDTVYSDDGTSSLAQLMEQPMIQAASGILVLFVLMGALILRGRGKNARSDVRRREAAEEMMLARGIDSLPSSRPTSERRVRTPQPPVRKERGGSMFEDYRRK